MCIGAMRGFAWLKFSVSINIVGFVAMIVIIKDMVIIIGVMSFVVIRGWKFILSVFDKMFKGFDEPFS